MPTCQSSGRLIGIDEYTWEQGAYMTHWREKKNNLLSLYSGDNSAKSCLNISRRTRADYWKGMLLQDIWKKLRRICKSVKRESSDQCFSLTQADSNMGTTSYHWQANCSMENKSLLPLIPVLSDSWIAFLSGRTHNGHESWIVFSGGKVSLPSQTRLEGEKQPRNSQNRTN